MNTVKKSYQVSFSAHSWKRKGNIQLCPLIWWSINPDFMCLELYWLSLEKWGFYPSVLKSKLAISINLHLISGKLIISEAAANSPIRYILFELESLSNVFKHFFICAIMRKMWFNLTSCTWLHSTCYHLLEIFAWLILPAVDTSWMENPNDCELENIEANVNTEK